MHGIVWAGKSIKKGGDQGDKEKRINMKLFVTHKKDRTWWLIIY